MCGKQRAETAELVCRVYPKALGQEIGKANSIEETPESTSMFANSYLAAKPRGTAGPTLAPGQQSISASVTVSFDLI